MFSPKYFTRLSEEKNISWFDLFLVVILFSVGFIYLHNSYYWGIAYIGKSQYGDAKLWWDGAIHVAKGIFTENPGKGLRPGYFLLTGLTLPILGQIFQHFYIYFLLVFLSVVSFFYFSLRLLVGRWVAACSVGMIIFNPYTAEWLSTSTTDGTGLLLNLAALACLFFGCYNGLKKGALFGFGFLFSLATLTRPLMTIFIFFVFFVLIIYPKISFNKKLSAILVVLFAFCIPTGLWMCAQKLIMNQWSISTNDASAFYAASDPKIQVWNGDMYTHIAQLVKQRFPHTEKMEGILINKLTNQTFWNEALQNYLRYPRYHIQRIFPHIVEIAHFSPLQARHGTDSWRNFFLMLLGLGMGLNLLCRKYFFRGLILLILGLSIWFIPQIVMVMTLLGVISAFISKSKNQGQIIFLLSCYWLTGVFALYLVGGTWGPPLGPLFSLNALGYRLGSQVFFAGDILAGYFLYWLTTFKLSLFTTEMPLFLTRSRFYQRLNLLFHKHASFPAKIIVSASMIFLFNILVIYCVGGAIVLKNTYAELYTSAKPYPNLNSAIMFYANKLGGSLPIVGSRDQGVIDWHAAKKMSEKHLDVIFIGEVSSFIWNFAGQNRAWLEVHVQNKIFPQQMGPQSMIIEVPQHLNIKTWTGLQGAFIISKINSTHDTSNMPYYLTAPVLRAFIPLAKNKQSFDLDKAIFFPLVKNATQLESSGDLSSVHAKISWSVDSGTEEFKRRFLMTPNTKNNQNKMQLLLNLPKTHGQMTLNFYYQWADLTPGPQNIKNLVDLKIILYNKNGVKNHQILINPDIFSAKSPNPLNNVALTIPPNIHSIKINFNNPLVSSGVWLYEFNLEEAVLSEASHTT